MHTFLVCILTYKRNDLLALLLFGLFKQKISNKSKFEILVIDNDEGQGALEVVDGFAQKGIKISYIHNVRKNLSALRNVGIEQCKLDYIIFMDDDARPLKETWFLEFSRCVLEFNADVVHAPILPEYPDDAPRWIVRSGFFERSRAARGQRRYRAKPSCNVAIRQSFITKHDIRFDEKFGLTGGEDTMFFMELMDSGALFAWCDNAQAVENFPRERVNIKWMTVRAFRGGNTYCKVLALKKGLSARVVLMTLVRLFLFTPFVPLIPFFFLIVSKQTTEFARKYIECIGRLVYMVGFEYKEYK